MMDCNVEFASCLSAFAHPSEYDALSNAWFNIYSYLDLAIRESVI